MERCFTYRLSVICLLFSQVSLNLQRNCLGTADIPRRSRELIERQSLARRLADLSLVLEAVEKFIESLAHCKNWGGHKWRRRLVHCISWFM
ncbi:hypothetical protein V8F44DRAFT_617492 [Aspergillus fumigatus]